MWNKLKIACFKFLVIEWAISDWIDPVSLFCNFWQYFFVKLQSRRKVDDRRKMRLLWEKGGVNDVKKQKKNFISQNYKIFQPLQNSLKAQFP